MSEDPQSDRKTFLFLESKQAKRRIPWTYWWWWWQQWDFWEYPFLLFIFLFLSHCCHLFQILNGSSVLKCFYIKPSAKFYHGNLFQALRTCGLKVHDNELVYPLIFRNFLSFIQRNITVPSPSTSFKCTFTTSFRHKIQYNCLCLSHLWKLQHPWLHFCKEIESLE
jgi:hypothetical protein